MTFNQPALHQHISLKGISDNVENYHAVIRMWDFKKAIEYYLTDDINILTK